MAAPNPFGPLGAVSGEPHKTRLEVASGTARWWPRTQTAVHSTREPCGYSDPTPSAVGWAAGSRIGDVS
jgi:hypothetical protein